MVENQSANVGDSGGTGLIPGLKFWPGEYHGLRTLVGYIPWTVAHQAPLSIGFSRQEYWSGLPCPSRGDLPDPGMEPVSSALPGGFFTAKPPGKPLLDHMVVLSLVF